MKEIRCLIADDELLARNVIKSHIELIGNLQVVAECKTGTEVYHTISDHQTDLVFLDIKMPGISGIELLRTLKNPPGVIITTAYSEFAVEGYELNVIDYLLKPISFERFLKAVNKFRLLTNTLVLQQEKNLLSGTLNELQPFIYVKTERKMVKILFSDILYIEGLKDYVKIETTDQQHITYSTLTYFQDRLPDNRFIRIHRSFIVNLACISSFSGGVVMINTVPISIGRTYLKKVKTILSKL
ncbi:two component transcriptional regulator, LytTR family [Pedobacter westerhofensis]|uniref:Two component transcriptional regulator, LytTR family n=1 Tax=Pedobacter westerhofensis TaxID=425512 RepID=A0A521AJX9_9SPHI|nr:LytTR family DNA-binding domain-containing protein [Pedobacter westerhofensis]SMO35071.1 two component transcriptional regulator, LytTR family [Pedobacter westerhofensis]